MIEVIIVSQLEKVYVCIGDMLCLIGIGMCNICMLGSWFVKEDLLFLFFDCLQIVWNDVFFLLLLEFDIVSKVIVLMQFVQCQLYLEIDDDFCVSFVLCFVIQKLGMVLLDDFGDIVQKINDFCLVKDDCLWLKNVLVNFGNICNWEMLIKCVIVGKLDGVNVLLWLVSVELLENLVIILIVFFVICEILWVVQVLNSLVFGGFFIVSDEGSVLVNQLWLVVSLYDYLVYEQWGELWWLVGMFMYIFFYVEGIVINLFIDVNGMQYINLYCIFDCSGLWCYLGIILLLLLMVGCMVYYVVQVLCCY